MAKKVRGARSSHRPGGQGPTRSRKPGDTAEPGPAPDRGADIDAAVESVVGEPSELVLHESALVAPAARKPRRGAKVRADSLQARVAAENVYVAEDLRRIALLTGGLFAAFLVAWVLLVPLDLAGLY